MAEPAQDSQLQLFNTLTGKLEPFVPLDSAGKQVKMYVCGPTVYDDAHLGHARCYITWDVLYRFLKFLGYDVTYVRNVTDVDDKILNRAKERGETPAALAERNYQRFTDDMKALNVLPPDEEPRATQYIPQMLEGIQALIDKGAAYATADGSVYFRVSAKPDYGKLKFGTDNPEALKKHLKDLKSGARVEVDEEKESPLDFALWKAVPASDPNGWVSPWASQETGKGWGRPGWHMECSAMNHAVFGEQIDIHAGGADLIFPHHENEIAQSEAWSGHQPFAKYWLHNGFVNTGGEKMSKSLGNFSTIKELLERSDANTIRYFLLSQHYSTPVDFNGEALSSSEIWMKKTESKLIKIFQSNNWTVEQLITHARTECSNSVCDYLFRVQDAMEFGLNTASALAELNKALSNIRLIAHREQDLVLLTEADKKVFFEVVLILDLLGFSLDFLKKDRSVSDVLVQSLTELIQARKIAKAEKNWAEADRLRNEILAQGYQILDNKDGTTSVEKDGLEILRV